MSLKNILNSRVFYPSFCLEEASYGHTKGRLAFAVVCFADLRRSELGEHMKNFNSQTYIKMSKSWAIKKGLSPVIYYSEKSTLSSAIYRSIFDFAHNYKAVLKFYNSVNLMMGLLKQYKGHYYNKYKNEFSKREVCFYLEREWRYIPIPQNGEDFFISESDFLNVDIRSAKEKKLRTGCALDFTWDDILEVGGSVVTCLALVHLLSAVFSVSMFEAASKIKVVRCR